MIALARAELRRFRLVTRRCVVPGRPRDHSLPIRLTAEGGTVTLTAHLVDVVVALRVPAAEPGSGSIVLPLADLERFEGSDSSPVFFKPESKDRVAIQWKEGANDRSAEFDVMATDREWPEEPEHLISLPPSFPLALHEAGRSTDREPGKYASNRLQIRGKAGQIVATDGKQALIQGGFKFSFAEDLLVPAIPAFGGKELGNEGAVSIGVTGDWLYLVMGPWRFWLAVDREGRFPDVIAAIPKATGTRIAFDEADVNAVLEALPRMPKDDEEPQTVTLELGRRPAIRARAGKDGPITEVPLDRSECHGPDMLVLVNRAHLGRALGLGFREFRCASPERPMVAWDGPRMYITATFDTKSAIPARRSANSSALGSSIPVRTDRPQTESPPTFRSSAMPSREPPVPERHGHADSNSETLDPLAEAEGLRLALADAQARAGRLVTALRGFRKQHRTVTSALASLRSLRLE